MSSLEDVKQHWTKLGIEHFISQRENEIHVHQIVVPKGDRGKGVGSSAMSHLTKHADAVGHKITLSPSTDYGASSKSRLVKFYKSHGFVENKGKNKDYSISETMYRNPDTVKEYNTFLDIYNIKFKNIITEIINSHK